MAATPKDISGFFWPSARAKASDNCGLAAGAGAAAMVGARTALKHNARIKSAIRSGTASPFKSVSPLRKATPALHLSTPPENLNIYAFRQALQALERLGRSL